MKLLTNTEEKPRIRERRNQMRGYTKTRIRMTDPGRMAKIKTNEQGKSQTLAKSAQQTQN